MDNEYPKAMYQDGGPELIWGLPVQTRIVEDADEETSAAAEGWRLSPAAPVPAKAAAKTKGA